MSQFVSSSEPILGHMLIRLQNIEFSLDIQIQITRMNRRTIVPIISIFIYLAIYLLIVLLKPPGHDPLREIHSITHPLLIKLAEDNHFRHYSLPENVSGKNYTVYSLQEQAWEAKDQQTGEVMIAESSSEVQYMYDRQEQEQENIDVKKVQYDSLCPNNQKGSPSDKIFCQYLKGIIMAWSIDSSSQDSLKNHIKDMSIEDWNSIFLVYGVSGQALKLSMPGNITMTSDLEDHPQTTYLLSYISHRFHKADFSPITKQLKGIEDKVTFVYKISSLGKRLFEEQKQSFFALNILHFADAAGIALKVQSPRLQSHQFVSLVQSFTLASKAVGQFYGELADEIEVEHVESWVQQGKFYYFLFGAAVVMIYLLCQVDPKRKAQKQFRHVFPSSPTFKIQ